MKPVIETHALCKSYHGRPVVDHLNLTVPEGCVYGFLGPNGAGKTTLIRILNRITAPDKGEVIFDGRQMQPADVARIGYLPEERGLYRKMKVGEQALFFARLKGLSRAEAVRRLRVWFDRFDIASWWNRRVEELSKGMAQKVQFIVTVLHEPELLIFDEPFSGFDPINANLLKEEILGLRDRGATVIFSTHNMSSVEEICDHITLIDRSRNVLSGPVDEVRRRHGGNVFRIDFAGDLSALDLQALERVARVVAEPRPEGRLLTMRLQLPSADSVRSALSLLNERIEIRGFEEIIPSMNDIFIRAVGGEL